MVQVLDLQPLERGPLRHFQITATAHCYTLKHRRSGTTIGLDRQLLDEMIACRPDTCDVIDVFLGLLPPLCDGCGTGVPAGECVCEDCETEQTRFLQRLARRARALAIPDERVL